MILHVSPEAPLAVRAAASALLYSHIGGAFAGLAAGTVAMIVRKGASIHRAAGHVFFVAMLTMAGVGAVVAPFLPAQQLPNTLAGTFTFYLVATGWATVRRPAGRVGRFEVGALLFALCAVAAGIVMLGLNAVSGHPLPMPQGPVMFIFTAVTAIGAAGDFNMVRKGGLSGTPRLARHLWRLCVALLIAAASFAGQPKAFPHFMRGSPLLMLPALAVLLALIYWLIRVRVPRRPKRTLALAG